MHERFLKPHSLHLGNIYYLQSFTLFQFFQLIDLNHQLLLLLPISMLRPVFRYKQAQLLKWYQPFLLSPLYQLKLIQVLVLLSLIKCINPLTRSLFSHTLLLLSILPLKSLLPLIKNSLFFMKSGLPFSILPVDFIIITTITINSLCLLPSARDPRLIHSLFLTKQNQHVILIQLPSIPLIHRLLLCLKQYQNTLINWVIYTFFLFLEIKSSLACLYEGKITNCLRSLTLSYYIL